MGFVFNVCTAPLQCRVSCVLYSSKIMVEKVMHIISEYEERLRMCQHVRRLSFGRRMLRDDGAPNRFFLMYLSCDESMAIQYLTYHHSLFSIHSSCKFIRTILIILRLGLVLFFFNNLSPPASFPIQIHSFPQNHHHTARCCLLLSHFSYVTHNTHRYTTVAD
jgi:hypothetical protein